MQPATKTGTIGLICWLVALAAIGFVGLVTLLFAHDVILWSPYGTRLRVIAGVGSAVAILTWLFLLFHAIGSRFHERTHLWRVLMGIGVIGWLMLDLVFFVELFVGVSEHTV